MEYVVEVATVRDWLLVIGDWAMGGKCLGDGQAVEMDGLIRAGGASGVFLCLVAHFFGWGKVADKAG